MEPITEEHLTSDEILEKLEKEINALPEDSILRSIGVLIKPLTNIIILWKDAASQIMLHKHDLPIPDSLIDNADKEELLKSRAATREEIQNLPEKGLNYAEKVHVMLQKRIFREGRREKQKTFHIEITPRMKKFIEENVWEIHNRSHSFSVKVDGNFIETGEPEIDSKIYSFDKFMIWETGETFNSDKELLEYVRTRYGG